MFRPYVQAVRTPGALLPLAASFVGGGLPIGMLTLAVLLLVRLQSGSFLGAGIMAAALSAGNAVGVAVQGALIDRRGQTVVLVPASLICLSSLVALVLAATDGGPSALTTSLAVAGGAAIPATPSSMRVLWPTLVPDPQLRATAYALSAVSFTADMILGPVLVSGLLLLGGPQVAVLAAVGLSGAGGLLFAVTPASRRWAPAAARTHRRPRGWPGRGMRTLIAGNLAIGLAAGLSGVAVPAAGVALGAAALAGVFAAAGAAGDLCGGLIYGSVRWRVPLASRLVAAQCGSAVIGACLALASRSIPAMMRWYARRLQTLRPPLAATRFSSTWSLSGTGSMILGRGSVEVNHERRPVIRFNPATPATRRIRIPGANPTRNGDRSRVRIVPVLDMPSL